MGVFRLELELALALELGLALLSPLLQGGAGGGFRSWAGSGSGS
ncbi:MAG: hypothetical protein ACTIL9_13130 [Marinomonas sp.]